MNEFHDAQYSKEGSLDDVQRAAFEQLRAAEDRFLFVHGWTDVGNGRWEAPAGYFLGSSGPQTRTRGYAINSQKVLGTAAEGGLQWDT